MKRSNVFLCVLLFLGLSGASQGLAYGLDHDFYNRTRSPYLTNVYVSEQVQYVSSTVNASLREADKPLSSSFGVSDTTAKHGGYALATGVGLEHFKFLHTGVTYSLVDQTDQKNRLNGLRGHEVGAEAKLVFNSPVVNVIVGGGYFYAAKDFLNEARRQKATGTGVRGTLDLSYFIARNISLVASCAYVTENLSDKTEKETVKGFRVNSNRLGAGVSLWM